MELINLMIFQAATQASQRINASTYAEHRTGIKS